MNSRFVTIVALIGIYPHMDFASDKSDSSSGSPRKHQSFERSARSRRITTSTSPSASSSHSPTNISSKLHTSSSHNSSSPIPRSPNHDNLCKSASPPIRLRGKSSRQRALSWHASTYKSADDITSLGHIFSESTTLVIVQNPRVYDSHGRIGAHEEYVDIATKDRFSGLTLGDYLEARHKQNLPGIIALCWFDKSGLIRDYAIARSLQYHLDQCLSDNRRPHHPSDPEMVFVAAEYYLIDERMIPTFLGTNDMVRQETKASSLLKQILMYEIQRSACIEEDPKELSLQEALTIKTQAEIALEQQKKLQEQQKLQIEGWLTLGTYFNEQRNYFPAITWLNRVYQGAASMQSRSCQEIDEQQVLYGHVLHGIAYAYWQLNKGSKGDNELVLGWLRKARQRLEEERKPLDAIMNLSGRLYEKVGIIALDETENIDEERIYFGSQEPPMSARQLIEQAYKYYRYCLRSFDMAGQSEAPSASTSKMATHDVTQRAGLSYDALANMLYLYSCQQGLCAAELATKMKTYAHTFIHWPDKASSDAYQHDESYRHTIATQKARNLLLKTLASHRITHVWPISSSK